MYAEVLYMPIARLKFMLSVVIPYYLHQEHIMRKREGGGE